MHSFLKEIFSVRYQVLVGYRFFKPKMYLLLLLSNSSCVLYITTMSLAVQSSFFFPIILLEAKY